ncbi:glycosyltransferase [Lutimaribacter marinistellae]|uniref:Glycosyltransferase n=1 Tax=Lutimaribacter marinistellae TaxID=1820329 RepID=A0ABV7TCR2_9RHOB
MTTPVSVQYDNFDPVWYLQTYADVRNAGLDPWDHYRRAGRAEGRQGGPVQALELDLMLWRGYHDTALPALHILFETGPAHERAVAGWVLARWYVEHEDLSAARAALEAFHASDEGARTVGHPGPYLLGVQLALALDDRDQAAQLLDRGFTRFGALPDFELAQIQYDRFLGLDDWELSSALARIYVPYGLVPLHLRDDVFGPRFDRLHADPGPWLNGPTKDLPLVSVIVPVFNAARNLPTALRGLQAQTWPNIEIIIVDDGSSDESLSVAEAAAEKDKRIRVIAHTVNQGAYPARNTGFAAARGDYITVHDADDWSHPEKIARQATALMNEPELKATVSHWVRASDDLAMTRWRMEEAWIYRNVSSLMIRAELRDILGYWDRVKVNADTEYYYRLTHSFGPKAIREVCPGVPLAFGRTDPGSLTMRSATHLRTQFKGLRRDYMEAAHYWHTQAREPSELYLPQNPEQRPFRVPEAIGLGDAEGPETDYDILRRSEYFDADWYRLSHKDVLLADICPVQHYLQGGAAENRDPGPRFSTGGYRRAQELPEEVNPLLHFETVGKQNGAAPLPAFDGVLSDTPAHVKRTLVFAHTSGKTLFGAERSLLGVVERMARRGHCPVVVLPTLRNPEYLKQLLTMTAAVEFVPQLWYHALRPAHEDTVQAIRDLIVKYGAKHIHVNTMVLNAPLFAARAEGVRTTVHVRELPDQDVALRRHLGASAGALRQHLVENADRFVATSPSVAQWLGCPDRTVIRPNSVDEDLFDLRYSPQTMLRVAMISSNIAKKGIADFLGVARRVESHGRPIRFLLIGPPSEDLHLMRPWPGNVDFRNYAATPAEAVAQADIVMSLSKFAESFGRTVMEAMAGGRPVVCYDRGAPPSLVESGRTGFVVPADDIEAAANAILALEASRNGLMRMSTAARAKARSLQEQAMQA